MEGLHRQQASAVPQPSLTKKFGSSYLSLMTKDQPPGPLPLSPDQWRDLEKYVTQLHGATARHNVRLQGTSGATYQIDCLIEFRHGLHPIRIIVECKDWRRPVDRPEVDKLISVAEDCGASRAAIFSAWGFTEGSKLKARHKNIGLYWIREMVPSDWPEGELRLVCIRGALNFVQLDSSEVIFPPGYVRTGELLSAEDAIPLDKDGNCGESIPAIIKRETTRLCQPIDGPQEIEIPFPEGTHWLVRGRKVAIEGVKVSFHRLRLPMDMDIDLGKDFKGAIEDLMNGEIHRITKNDEVVFAEPKENR